MGEDVSIVGFGKFCWIERPARAGRKSCTGECTRAGLHHISQVAMGWTDSHLQEFQGCGPADLLQHTHDERCPFEGVED